jgi:DNA-binding beta-propeller fold protein YncE
MRLFDKRFLRPEMRRAYLLVLILLLAIPGCGKRMKLPTDIPQSVPGAPDTTYVPVGEGWTEAGGIPFDRPQDVHVGLDGHVYIADTGNDRIVELDQAGDFVAHYHGAKEPRSISQDPLFRLLAAGGNTIYIKLPGEDGFDSLYAGDDIYDSIMVVRPDTLIDTVIISPDSIEIDTIMGLIDTVYFVDTVTTNFAAIAPDPRPVAGYGMYFVCDSTRDEISRFLLIGSDALYRMGAAVPSGYRLSSTHGPTGVFTYLRGDKFRFLFCQALSYFSVQLLDGDDFGPLIPQTESSQIYWEDWIIGLAQDVAADEFENIFVVDSEKSQVHKFSRNGVPILSFGREGSGQTDFKNPLGIAYANKILYVADTGNNRILRFALSNEFLH